MTTDPKREAFESWARSKCLSTVRFGDHYRHIEDKWVGWQAALSQPPEVEGRAESERNGSPAQFSTNEDPSCIDGGKACIDCLCQGQCIGYLPTAHELLVKLRPYIDSIICYASTAGEYDPNRIALDVERYFRAAAEASIDPSTPASYIAGMVGAYLGWGVEDKRIAAIAGIIERRAKYLTAPSAGHGEGWVSVPNSMSDAARDVLSERQRQISAEGWTPEHDDEHSDGEMALAAACYANPEVWNILGASVVGWPWDPSWYKPTTRRRDLVKAGALILAEIERIDRTTPKDNRHE